MANRHLSRSIVLQTLFEWDFISTSGQSETWTDKKTKEVLNKNLKEFAPGLEDNVFVFSLVEEVLKKYKAVDEIIKKAAPDWPLDKISIVDRNILRIGLTELLFGNRNQVPPKVAINEAIELAKTFGGENSGKFVNGVFGAVYKEIGEPGKEAVSKKKEKRDIPVEILGGALVFAKEKSDIYVALVHDIFGHWTLSKGHLEVDEEESKGTERVVEEEIGLKLTAKDCIGRNEYIASHPEKGKIKKQVVYFLAEAHYEDIKLAESGGLDDARWFKLSDILDLNFYGDILPIVTKGVQILLEKK